MNANRRGLTLIELMVALAVGGLVLTMAHRAVGDALASVAAIERSRLAQDRAGNARRRVTAALGNLELTGHAEDAFLGDSITAAFTTWLPAPGGDLVRSRVRIALSSDARMIVLTAAEADASSETALWAATGVAFDYLVEQGLAAPWLREWHSPVTAPRAVRIRVRPWDAPEREDTTLVVVGPRG